MFSADGLSRVLTALTLVGPWAVRFDVDPTIYATDPGYPVVHDPDERNTGRGQHVATWRVTVPRGTYWATPATKAYLVNALGEMMYTMPLVVPFGTSPTHPSILFLNIYFTR